MADGHPADEAPVIRPLIDVRSPEHYRKEELAKIEGLRKSFGMLGQAWSVFHGSETLSKESQELVKKYFAAHPDAIDPRTRKITAAHLKTLEEILRKREPTFETLSFHNETVAAHERLKLSSLPRPLSDENLRNLDHARNEETLWALYPRLIRRGLRTLDRYVLLRSRYTYPGLTHNEPLEKTCQAELQRLTELMQGRMKADVGDQESYEVQIRTLLVTFMVNIKNLYIGFIDAALQRNMKIRQESGGRVAEPRFKQLEAEGHDLLFEAHSFLLHGGLQSIRDLQVLAIPELATDFDIRGVPAMPDIEPWGGNSEAGHKFVAMNIVHITDSFRDHFHDVLGEPHEDGTPARSTGGLFEINAGIRSEAAWTDTWRMRMRDLCNSLVLYQGGVRWGVGTTARAPFVGIASLIGLGDAVDAFLPSPRTPEAYAKEIMAPVLEAMGLPPGFDFTEGAWKALRADPVALKRFEERNTSIRKILQESEEGARKAINVFQEDLAMVPLLQDKIDIEQIRKAAGEGVDEAWLKAHRGGLTRADIAALSRDNPRQVLAAFVILFDQMMDHWTVYNTVMDQCAARILTNVDAHGRLGHVLPIAAANTQRDLWWLVYLAGGLVGYGVLSATLGRYGRVGGWSGTAGITSSSWNFVPFNRAWSPSSIINGALFRSFSASTERVAGATVPLAEVIPAAQKLRGDFLGRIRNFRVPTGTAAADAGAVLQNSARTAFDSLAHLERGLLEGSTELAQVKAIRVEMTQQYLQKTVELLAADNPALAGRLNGLLSGGRLRANVVEAIWDAHRATSVASKNSILTGAGIPADIVELLLDGGACGENIRPATVPVLRRMAALSGRGLNATESPFLFRLSQLSTDAERGAALSLVGRNPALSRVLTTLEGEAEFSSAVRLLSARSVIEINGFIGLSNRLSQPARLALLGLEEAQFARILSLCSESAPLRAALAEVRVFEFATLAQNLSRHVELVPAIRALASTDAAAAKSVTLLLADSTRTIETVTLVSRFSTTGRLVDKVSLLRRVGGVLLSAPRATIKFVGRSIHTIGKVAAPLAVLAEAWAWRESETTLAENRERASNVLTTVRAALRIGQEGSKFREDRPGVFVHTSGLCTIDGNELERKLVDAVGIDVARTYNNLGAMIGAVLFFFGPIGMGLGAIVALANFIFNAHLRDDEAQRLVELTNDLPPELLVALPLSQLRTLNDYKDRGEFGYFISIRNYMQRRVAAVVAGSANAQGFNLARTVVELPGRAVEGVVENLFGDGGRDPIVDALAVGGERADKLRKEMHEALQKEISSMETPLSATIFYPVFHEISRMVPPQLLAREDGDVVRTVWEDRALILQTFMRFLPELSFLRETFSNENYQECAMAMRQTAAYYVRHRLLQVFEERSTRVGRHDKALETLRKGLLIGGITATDESLTFTATSSIVSALARTPGAENGWKALAGIPAVAPAGMDPATNMLTPRTLGVVEALECLDLDTEILPILAAVGACSDEQKAHIILVLQALSDPRERIVALRRLIDPAQRESLLKMFASASSGGLLTIASAERLRGLVDATGNARPGGWPYSIREVAMLRDAGRLPEGWLPLPRRNPTTGRFEITFTQADAAAATDTWESPEFRFQDLDAAAGLYLSQIGARRVNIASVSTSTGIRRSVATATQVGTPGWVLEQGGSTIFFSINEGRLYSATATGEWVSVTRRGRDWTKEQIDKNPALARENAVVQNLSTLQENLPLPLGAAAGIERAGITLLTLNGGTREEIDGFTRYVVVVDGRTFYFACFGGRWHTSGPAYPLWLRCEDGYGALAQRLSTLENRFNPELLLQADLRRSYSATGDLLSDAGMRITRRNRPSMDGLGEWDITIGLRSHQGVLQMYLVSSTAGAGSGDRMTLPATWMPIQEVMMRVNAGPAPRIRLAGLMSQLGEYSRTLYDFEESTIKRAAEYNPLQEIEQAMLKSIPVLSEAQYLRGTPLPDLRESLFGNDPIAPTVLRFGGLDPNEPRYATVWPQLVAPLVETLQATNKRRNEAGILPPGTHYPQIVQLRQVLFSHEGIEYEAVSATAIWAQEGGGRITTYTSHMAVRPNRPGATFMLLPARSAGIDAVAPLSVLRAPIEKELEALLKERAEKERRAKMETVEKVSGSMSTAERIYCATITGEPTMIEDYSGMGRTLYALRIGDNLIQITLAPTGELLSYCIVPATGTGTAPTWESDFKEMDERYRNRRSVPEDSPFFPLTKRQQENVKILAERLRKASFTAYVPGSTDPQLAMVLKLINTPPAQPLNRFISDVANEMLVSFDPFPRIPDHGAGAITRQTLIESIAKHYADVLRENGGVDNIQSRQSLRTAIRYVLHPHFADDINKRRFERLWSPENARDAAWEIRNRFAAPRTPGTSPPPMPPPMVG